MRAALLRFLALAWLALALAACDTLSVHGTPYVARSTDTPPPRSLAILPTVNQTDRPELGPLTRQALYRGLAPLPYQDRELEQIDDFVSRRATELNTTPAKLSLEAMADPRLADCVLYSQLTNASRLYLLLYSHIRIDLDLVLADTRNRAILYRNHFVIYDRSLDPGLDIPSLVQGTITSLWHLRSDEFKSAIDRATQRIADSLPKPQYDLAAGPTLRLTAASVTVPHPILREGDRVVVTAEGTPNCRSTFSVGRIAVDQPLVEASPGAYTGSYKVKAGDDTPYAVVQVVLQLPDGRETARYDVREPSFAIDTAPPPRARVLRPRLVNGERGITFDIGLIEVRLLPLKHDDNKYTYQILRRAPGQSEFVNIGQTGEPFFHDSTMDPAQSYEYFIVVSDEAGNVSLSGPVYRYVPARR